MEITVALVKELREKTNAGMMDCKKALQETGGDIRKAIDYLRQKGLAIAQKRAGRATTEGVVHSYIHAGGRIGVLLEVNCETDFTAKSDIFQDFAKNLTMQIAATNPLGIRRDDISENTVEREKDIYRQQALDSGKPEKIVEKIIFGKINKFFQENCLLEQAYVKNPDITIQDYLNEIIGKTGENIIIRRFTRYQLGEDLEG